MNNEHTLQKLFTLQCAVTGMVVGLMGAEVVGCIYIIIRYMLLQMNIFFNNKNATAVAVFVVIKYLLLYSPKQDV